MQELRLRFLQCREAWLVEMLVEVEEGPAHDFLKRVTDIHRLHLFDIIMQFRALFAEEALGQVSLFFQLPKPSTLNPKP